MPHPEMLKELFDSFPLAVIALDTDRSVRFWNPAAEAMFGWSAAEVLNRPYPAVPEEKQQESKVWLQEVLSGTPLVHRETYRLTKSGATIPVRVSSSAILESNWVIFVVADMTENRRLQASLKEVEARYKTLFNEMGDAIFIHDLEGNYLEVNQTACDRYGYSREEFLRMSTLNILSCEDARLFPERLRRVRAGESPLYDVTHRHRGGKKTFHVEVCPRRILFRGEPAVLIVARDISARKAAEQAREQSEQRFRQVFANSGIAKGMANLGGTLIEANQTFCEMLGYTREELLSLTANEVIHAEDRERSHRHTLELFQGKCEKDMVHFKKRLIRKDGRTCHVIASVSLIRSEEGTPSFFLLELQDVTDQVKAKERIKETDSQLRHAVLHDRLTGLPNRLMFEEFLTKAIARARRNRARGAILHLGLDRFQKINNSWGHEAGDLALIEISRRLRANLRETDTIARFEGDQFLILLNQLNGAHDAVIIALKLLDQIAAPLTAEHNSFSLTGCIGISLFPAANQSPSEIIQNSEVALSRAKRKGSNCFQFYSPEMSTQAREQLQLESDLRLAMLRKELTLHYQPQVELQQGKIIGMECLVRWLHPTRGLVSPGEFIPVAEETGLIVPIGEWILQSACAQAKAWQEQGLPAVPMAVNISAKQFKESGFIETVDMVLAKTGIAPELVELEITESILMDDVEQSICTLTDLKARGLLLSVDDFGTGYSSLSYLKRFPLDKLKIDQSFVRDLTNDTNDAAIVASIIALAKTMGLKAIAEGVETEEQACFLRKNGCPEAQGFLFSRPLPVAQMTDYLLTPRESSNSTWIGC